MSVYDIEPGGHMNLRDPWERRGFVKTVWLLAMIVIAAGLLWALL